MSAEGWSMVGRSGGMPHWQDWSGSSSANTLVDKRLGFASVFHSALESQIMAMGFEPEIFEVLTAT